MKKWSRCSIRDIVNLDCFCHIWVEKGSNGYFLMGEMIHNSEEVVISMDWGTEIEAFQALDKLIFEYQ